MKCTNYFCRSNEVWKEKSEVTIIKENVADSGNNNYPIKILVAEDNVGLQQIFVEMLQLCPYHFTIVDNGKKVLEELSASHYDLILMDLQMPVMSGLEATEKIRKLERKTGEHIPIIAISGHFLGDYHDLILESGLDGYLAKPFGIDELSNTIEVWANNKKVAT